MAKPEDAPPDRELPAESDRTSLEDFQRLIDDIDAAAPSVKGDSERLDQVLGFRAITGFQEPPTKLRNPFAPPTTKNQRKRRPTLEGPAKLGPPLPPPVPGAAPPRLAPSTEAAAPPAPPALPRAPGLPPTAPEPSLVPARAPTRDASREPPRDPNDGRVLVRAAGLRRRESQPSQPKPPPGSPPAIPPGPPIPTGPRVPPTRPLSRPSPRPAAGLLARAALKPGAAGRPPKTVPSARAGSQQSDPELRAAPSPRATGQGLDARAAGASDLHRQPERSPHAPAGSLVHVGRTTDPRAPRVTDGGARVHPSVLAHGAGTAPDAPLRGTPAPEPLDLAEPPGGTPTVTEPVPESLLESAAHLGPDLWFRPKPTPAPPSPSPRLLDALTLVVLVLFFEAAALPTAAGPPWELLVRPTDPSFVGCAALLLAAVVYVLPLGPRPRAILNVLAAALVIPVALALVGLAVARNTFDAQPALEALFAGSLLAPMSLLAAFVLLPAGLFARAYAARARAPTGLIAAGVAALALGLVAPGLPDAPLVAQLFDSVTGASALGDHIAAIATLPALALALAALYCAIPGRGARIAGPLGVALWVALALPLAVLALFVASGDTWTLVLEPFKIATLVAAAALYGAVATTQIVCVAASRSRARPLPTA